MGVAHTIYHTPTLIVLQLLGGNNTGCHMTLDVIRQVVTSIIINMAH